MANTVLLHICCAVCLPGTLSCLSAEGFQVSGYFYNPNIHPLLEFRKRLKAVKVLNERLKIPLYTAEDYGLEHFLTLLDGDFSASRCAKCYRHRLNTTALFARVHGFSAFTSTLLVSHEQHHDMIRSIGEQAAEEQGVEFVYRDFRPFVEEGKDLARRASIYRQQYCGCIFSERDRYKDTHQDVYTPPDGAK